MCETCEMNYVSIIGESMSWCEIMIKYCNNLTDKHKDIVCDDMFRYRWSQIVLSSANTMSIHIMH